MAGARRFSAISLALAALVMAVSACRPNLPPKPPVGDTMMRGMAKGLSELPEPNLRFRDVTAASGVDFVYRNGEEANHAALPEILGGGAALWDYDLDGQLDLILPGGGQLTPDGSRVDFSATLYRNMRSLRFESVGEQAGLSNLGLYAHGAFAADYDEDGFLDLLVTGYGGLRFFRNLGDGTFDDATTAAALTNPNWSTGAAWGDIDGDGDLDLYVARFVDWNPNNPSPGPELEDGSLEYGDPKDIAPLPDSLYLNQGDGTFRDVAREWGIRGDGRGLGVVAGDVDLDGDVDLYVANFASPNFLYRNDGEQRLVEIGESSGAGLSRDDSGDRSAGVDFGDLDRDGYPDIWVTNGNREMAACYRNVARNLYFHASHLWGIAGAGSTWSGWGTALADFDADQDLDIVAAAGHRLKSPTRQPRQQASVVLENGHGTRFLNIAPQMRDFFSERHVARGVAVGDLDEDGDLDVVITCLNEPVVILENRSVVANHSLQLRLIGTKRSRTPIGARVEVATSTRDQVLLVRSGGGYLSTHDPRVHIGLGADSRVETLRIVWPGGGQQVLHDVAAGQTLIVREPAE